MEVNINNEALDEYSTLYDNEDFVLVKAFKNKGFDEDVLHDIKRIELLINELCHQKKICNGDDNFEN